MRELNSFFGTLYAVNVYRNLYPPFNDLEPIGEISRRNDSNSISNSSKNEEYYKVVDFKTISTQECIICFDSFGPEKECVELKCNPLHVFHKDCIYEWTKHNTNCPICRKRLIRRRLGASDSDSDLSIPRLMIIHQMPRLHQGDEDVSSEDDDLGRDDLLFNRIFNRRFSPRIHHLDPINDFDRDQNRLQNEVQEVRNRLNDIVSRLQEIQEEVRQRPHIADFIYNHSNRDESPLDSSFSENSARNPSILEVISEESKENNNERQSQSFRSVISPNIPELMQDDY